MHTVRERIAELTGAAPAPRPTQPPLQAPFQARHVELSAIASLDDEKAQPTPRLLALAIDAAEHARKIALPEISARLPHPPLYPDIWPGEHYKLLAGITLTLQPKLVVEIGTGSGLSALTFKQFLPSGGRVVSFDLRSWRESKDTVLREEDFTDGMLAQYGEDLSNPLLIPNYLHLLSRAEVIFLDASKDGETEIKLLRNLESIPFEKPPLVILDDIKLWKMLKIWREIKKPKLDVTSFGHWSGTGLVDWVK